jgi:hypothetical protein
MLCQRIEPFALSSGQYHGKGILKDCARSRRNSFQFVLPQFGVRSTRTHVRARQKSFDLQFQSRVLFTVGRVPTFVDLKPFTKSASAGADGKSFQWNLRTRGNFYRSRLVTPCGNLQIEKMRERLGKRIPLESWPRNEMSLTLA